MKLLVLSIEFPPGPGGLGTLAFQIAKHLTRAGWAVTVSTPQDHVDRSTVERFNAGQPFLVRRLDPVEPPLREGIYRFREAWRIVRQTDTDVLVAVGKQAVWVGAVLSLVSGVPLVAVGIGSEFVPRRGMDRALTRLAFWRAKCPIAISRHSRELARSAGIKLDRMRVVHCGADAALYRPGLVTDELRQRLGLGGSRVILTVGRVSRRKAQDVVIRALAQVTRDRPRVTYLVVGLPTRRMELEQLARECGVEDKVRFLGQVPQEELPMLYNMADVFVLVSRPTEEEVEGYGIVVAEAALCGVPAVVSSQSGLVEAVLDNKTALVVPPDDPDATAQAIARLLTDETLRQHMGRAARCYALESATWDRRIREYDEILRELV